MPRIAITPGEPAGIGPDLVLSLLREDWPAELVVIGDPGLLDERARMLGERIATVPYRPDGPLPTNGTNIVSVEAVPLRARTRAGHCDKANAPYVLATIARAVEGCLSGEFAALVTGPVQKSIIAEAGLPFSGHTEYLAELTGALQPVMMLVADTLRVALLTTHLPLREVPQAVTDARLRSVLRVLDGDLRRLFGLEAPRIAVLGLNPHAGEGGHLGTEERDIMAPALEALRAGGMLLTGPLPADTAFTPAKLRGFDAVLAIYHDQGLPVLKHAGFGRAVNVTLGLPIVRTSVDHGTALELAGSGSADAGSLRAALALAIEIAARRQP